MCAENFVRLIFRTAPSLCADMIFGKDTGGIVPGFFLFVRSLLSASFAKRSARRRAVLMPMASFSASYSCIASAASRARSSFAPIVARRWAFFKVVAVGISSVPAVHCGFVTWQKRTPRLAGQTRGSEPPSFASTSVVKALWPSCRLRGAQILSSRLTSPAVCNDVEGDLLPLVEGAHACAFSRLVRDFGEKVVSQARYSRRGQVVRPKLDER